ncbi:helix-turn-helix domain-containing protein [Eubacteriaceae bacterium ES3]|nr:helix-turn-helix domain-containing protein [Eubacteriaceae bacterium ES3]
MIDNFYTVEQISKMLDIHPKTIQRYIREGKLNATKIGKSWRITEHDLSLFTEGNRPAPSPDMQPKNKAKASAVVDIEVANSNEAIRIINSLNAAMNVKPVEFGTSSMQTQLIDNDTKLRITLWGSIRFLSAVLNTLEVYSN